MRGCPVEVLSAPPTQEQLAQLCTTGDDEVLAAPLRDDLGAATQSRIGANTPDVLTDATADVAILLMLAAAVRLIRPAATAM